MEAKQTRTDNETGGLPQVQGAEGSELASTQSGVIEQYITFTIGDEEYGVDIMSVREIKGWSDTTMLPNTPDHMRGVLNLRGIIVPIFDLRCRFSLGLTETTPLHVIVIIDIGDRLIGILVDTVSDILSIDSSEIRAVPKMGSQIDEEYLTGLVTVNERMVALLDSEKLFSEDQMNSGFSAAAESS
jgi:purine-binding chemotaxis protein CheW